MGMGIKGISGAFELSRNTVRKYVRMFQESGIPIPKLMEMSESRLQEMFVGGRQREYKPSPRRLELEALLPEYAARLKRKGVTVKSLYAEYASSHPEGYRHANFQMYIDFAGDRLEVIDEMSGEARSVEVFVAILPCSHCTYCEAVWSQRKEDLIKGLRERPAFLRWSSHGDRS